MKLIVGLGNPGNQYEKTRHNIGFSLVDEAARAWGVSLEQKKFSALFGEARVGRGQVSDQKVGLMKPQTFMNRSGDSVAEAAQFFKLRGEEILVAHDDLDLELGRVKLDFGRGSAGHRGVESIIGCLGKDFYRLRLGIGRPERKEEVESFVLTHFLAGELESSKVLLRDGLEKITAWIGQFAPA